MLDEKLLDDEKNLRQVSLLPGPAAMAQLVEHKTTADKTGASNPIATKRS